MHSGDYGGSDAQSRFALLEGFRYGKRPAVSRRAGVVAGVVGSVPAVGWAIVSMLERAWFLPG